MVHHGYDNDSSSSDSEFEDDDLSDLIMVRYMIECKSLFKTKRPCRTSMLSGREYILEVMAGNPTVCYENFRMRPHVFRNLCDKLRIMHLLQDLRGVSVEEGVAMGFSVLCHNDRQRKIADRFQHSTKTVHVWVKKVMKALVALGTHLIKPVNRGPIQPEIRNNPKWYPYFQKCVGAIDGTHVAAWAPASKQKTFRGRKVALVTQNVMAACSQDMLFTFVYTRWEGTANDGRVFLDALSRPDNKFPFLTDDHYYVVDAGYPNIPGFLAPYRNERYHLQEFRGRRGQGFTRKYELFNYRHSSLRNVIERCFGVLKARFPILKIIPNYPLRRQKLIPLACCTLHNFIIMEDRADELFTLYGREGVIIPNEQDLGVQQEGGQVDMSQQSQMLAIRESIATQMWNDYQQGIR